MPIRVKSSAAIPLPRWRVRNASTWRRTVLGIVGAEELLGQGDRSGGRGRLARAGRRRRPSGAPGVGRHVGWRLDWTAPSIHQAANTANTGSPAMWIQATVS